MSDVIFFSELILVKLGIDLKKIKFINFCDRCC